MYKCIPVCLFIPEQQQASLQLLGSESWFWPDVCRKHGVLCSTSKLRGGAGLYGGQLSLLALAASLLLLVMVLSCEQ